MLIKWDSSTTNEDEVPMYVADFLNGKRRKHVIVNVLTLGGLALDPAVQGATFVAFRDSLRALVDQWIESGRPTSQAEGDEPLTRHLIWVSDAYPKPIFETLHEFSQRNPLRLIPDRKDGVLVARLDVRANMRDADSVRVAREFGIAWFQRLMESPVRHRLSHCVECGLYFVRKRSPKKGVPIYRGVRCADCVSKGGVKRSLDSRKAAKDEMVAFAAKVFNEWKYRNENPDQRKWVADQVSRRFRKRLNGRPLTRRWVSQNLKAIQSKIRRRIDAKG